MFGIEAQSPFQKSSQTWVVGLKRGGHWRGRGRMKEFNCTVGTHEIKIKFWISHWELQVLIFHLTTFKARGVTEIRIAGKSCGASSSNMDPISKATALTGYSPSEKSVQFVQGLHCPVSHTCVCCLWKEPLMQPSWGAPITWTGSLSPEEDKWLDSEVLTDNEAFYAVKSPVQMSKFYTTEAKQMLFILI